MAGEELECFAVMLIAHNEGGGDVEVSNDGVGCVVDDAGANVAVVHPCWEVDEVFVRIGWGEAAEGKCLDSVKVSHGVDNWSRLGHVLELGRVDDEEEA
eukprot:scaffold145927_cov23-Cyclotella_meneghiniana.AAC.2